MARRRELADVDWSSLVDAYGPAVEVPGLLRAVRSPDPETRRAAYAGLTSRLVHQGSRYAASVAAVPFLADVVADRAAPARWTAAEVLASIAVGDEIFWLTEPPDLPALRREVARKAGLSTAELDREQQAEIDGIADEQARSWRASISDVFTAELERDAEAWTMQAYDAVRAEVPVLVAALRDPLLPVRLSAAYVLAWFPEERAVIAPALAELIAGEREPDVLANACVAAGLCGAKNDPALVEALSARRGDTNELVRWTAALGLAWLVPRPDRALVEELYACLVSGFGTNDFWFLEGDVSAFAAVTLGALDAEAVPDRVEILIEWLTAEDAEHDDYLLMGALLEAAFPAGPMVAGTAFDALPADQRKVALTLWRTRVWTKGAMIAMLVDKYNLPRTEAELRTWCGLG